MFCMLPCTVPPPCSRRWGCLLASSRCPGQDASPSPLHKCSISNFYQLAVRWVVISSTHCNFLLILNNNWQLPDLGTGKLRVVSTDELLPALTTCVVPESDERLSRHFFFMLGLFTLIVSASLLGFWSIYPNSPGLNHIWFNQSCQSNVQDKI